MSRNDIIAELYNSKEFKETILKMNPAHLQDDLKSEVMLILCEKDEEEIKSIYQSGGLKYYTVRIILNLIQSNTSPFYKKFRTQNLDISYFGDGEHRLEYCDETSDNFSGIITSDILKNYSKNIINIIHDDLTEGQEKQLKECLALDEINNLYWYDKEVIKLYLKLGTYRAVEAETGIPWESIYKTVQKGCKLIKSKVA